MVDAAALLAAIGTATALAAAMAQTRAEIPMCRNRMMLLPWLDGVMGR